MFNSANVDDAAKIWCALLDIAYKTSKLADTYTYKQRLEAEKATDLYNEITGEENTLPKMVQLLDLFLKYSARIMYQNGALVLFHLASGLPREVINGGPIVITVDDNIQLYTDAVKRASVLGSTYKHTRANMWNLKAILSENRQLIINKKLGFFIIATLEFSPDINIKRNLKEFYRNVPSGSYISLTFVVNDEIEETLSRQIEATWLVEENPTMSKGSANMYIRPLNLITELLGDWKVVQTVDLEELPSAPSVPGLKKLGTRFVGVIAKK